MQKKVVIKPSTINSVLPAVVSDLLEVTMSMWLVTRCPNYADESYTLTERGEREPGQKWKRSRQT